jgi:hypothetical protein
VRVRLTALVVVTTVMFAGPAAAQVVKPRTPPRGASRLPAPAKLSASQLPDGKIRVVWTSVENATRYTLIRSVPPAPQAPVALPNPSDTEYVDSDVKPGSTYYYVVSADNEDRVGGMKATGPPVKAESRVAVDTAKTPPDSAKPAGVSPGTVMELTVVNANYVYPTGFIAWSPIQHGVQFMVERAQVTDAGPSTWKVVREKASCCSASDESAQNFPTGARLIYRVTAMDSATQTNRLPPKLSNEVVTYKVQVNPVEIAGGFNLHVYPTPTLFLQKDQIRQTRDLKNVIWMSLNESVATITPQGAIRGVAVGVTAILAIGTAADGSIQFVVFPTNVTQRT